MYHLIVEDDGWGLKVKAEKIGDDADFTILVDKLQHIIGFEMRGKKVKLFAVPEADLKENNETHDD